MSNRVRQIHRWLSVVFTLAFVVNIAVNLSGDQALATLVGLATVPVILLLMITGLYMFILPYTGRARAGAHGAVGAAIPREG